MSTKATHELAVFREFAQAINLDLSDGNVEARKPPQPDVWVSTARVARFYELGRILDEDEIAWTLEMIRQAPKPMPMDPARFKLIERHVLVQKLGKMYATFGKPVDLLLYWDWERRTPWTANDAPLGNTESFARSFAEHVLRPVLQSRILQFEIIHYFHRRTKRVLWSYNSKTGQSGPA